LEGRKEKKTVNGPLTSKIGNRVTFSVPGDVAKIGGGPSQGVIVDEVWADPAVNEQPPRTSNGKNDWGDYSFFAQLIRWDGDGAAESQNSASGYQIRLGYYRRRAGEDRWRFAGQTTIVTEWDTIKKLFQQTLAKQNWFSDNPEGGSKKKD
jgi:hypothetical protein